VTIQRWLLCDEHWEFDWFCWNIVLGRCSCYKTLQQGYSTHYLPPEQVKGTSSTCPICGAKSKPNGHVFSCRACGFKHDRHFVGAYNVGVRYWTKDVGSNVPPEWRRMQPPAEVAVPPAKLEVEAQKIPVLQFATGF